MQLIKKPKNWKDNKQFGDNGSKRFLTEHFCQITDFLKSQFWIFKGKSTTKPNFTNLGLARVLHFSANNARKLPKKGPFESPGLVTDNGSSGRPDVESGWVP